MCFAQLPVASGNNVNESYQTFFFFFTVHGRKLFLNEIFFLLDSIKLLALNEEEPHEKELGHVTIQLLKSDVKRKKKTWHF